MEKWRPVAANEAVRWLETAVEMATTIRHHCSRCCSQQNNPPPLLAHPAVTGENITINRECLVTENSDRTTKQIGDGRLDDEFADSSVCLKLKKQRFQRQRGCMIQGDSLLVLGLLVLHL